MKTQTSPSTRPAARKGTTEVLAEMFGVRTHTPVASYCRHGHWQSLVPVKLPNGRLMWDLDEANRLLDGEAVKTPDAEQIAVHFARKAADASKVPAHILIKKKAKSERLASEGGK